MTFHLRLQGLEIQVGQRHPILGHHEIEHSMPVIFEVAGPSAVPGKEDGGVKYFAE